MASPCQRQFQCGGSGDARAGHAQRVTQRNRTAVRVDPWVIIGNAQRAQGCKALRREGFVQLDHSHILRCQSKAHQQLAACGHRADAHDARRNTRRGPTQDSGNRRQSVVTDSIRRREDQCRRSVIDPGRIARRDAATFAKRGGQSGKRFGARLGARVFIAVNNHRIALALRDFNGCDFARQPAARQCRRRLLLRAQGEGVLILAADAEVFGDVFGGFRHRADAILRLDHRVDKAPADGGIMDLGGPRKRLGGLGHDKRRARHAFDAACDDQTGLTRPDRPCARDEGVHPGPAQPVQRHARHAFGIAGQKQ